MDWGTWAQLAPLLHAGCRVWTQPPPFNHSKLMSVDDSWCFVGSSNLDMRSLRLNFELNVEIHDPVLATRVSELIVARQGRRVLLAQLQARPLLARLRDGAVRLIRPYL
jgi:cardiolipin synthase